MQDRVDLTQTEQDVIDAIILDALSDLHVTQFRIFVEILGTDDSTGCPKEHVLGAEITIDYRNLQATISLYPVVIQDFRKDPFIIIPVIYHEISHLVTSRFKDLVWPLLNLDIQYERACIDAHENTTEILGRLALKYRQSFDKSYRQPRQEESNGKESNGNSETHEKGPAAHQVRTRGAP